MKPYLFALVISASAQATILSMLPGEVDRGAERYDEACLFARNSRPASGLSSGLRVSSRPTTIASMASRVCSMSPLSTQSCGGRWPATAVEGASSHTTCRAKITLYDLDEHAEHAGNASPWRSCREDAEMQTGQDDGLDCHRHHVAELSCGGRRMTSPQVRHPCASHEGQHEGRRDVHQGRHAP